MFYVPFLNTGIDLSPGHAYSMFSVIFFSCLSGELDAIYPMLHDSWIKIGKKQPVDLCAANQVISVSMEVIIKQIIENPFWEHAANYTDTKVKSCHAGLDKASHRPTLAPVG